ncbi:MAG: type II toxin-antitoxin system VapC family toxin [Terracidiphilus sp.]
MRVLLDTHTLLWLLDGSLRLPPRALSVLRDPNTEPVISLVTPWELSIKCGVGKLDVADLLDGFETRLATAGYTVIETTVGQVIRSGLLPFFHRDPFDRLLAAQSIDLDIPLITGDPVFERYGVRRIWA